MTSNEWIAHEIRRLGVTADEPYVWWTPDICRDVPQCVASEVLNDDRFEIAVGSTVLWRDVSSANVGSSRDEYRDAILRVLYVSVFYACLVFPRERDFRALCERLPQDSAARRVLEFYTSRTDYRHIRNAIAHGNIDFSANGCELTLVDRKWERTISVHRLFLDCMMLSDVLQGAFEKARFPDPGPGSTTP